MFLYALKKKYEAEIAEHTSVVDTYLKNPVGIPDHDKILETIKNRYDKLTISTFCLLYTSPSPRDRQKSRMPSSA